MKLYVGNLPKDIDDAKLNDLVVPFGKVASASVVTDRDSSQSRGFGFVELNDNTEAQAAITGLNGKMVDGQALKVSEAKAKTAK